MSDISPCVLIVLDGWGYREAHDANAIYSAKTPTWDRLWQERPRTLISASGTDVGLPTGQMGNSEVGHMNLGAGRVVDQDFSLISRAIENRSFFDNEVLGETVSQLAASGKALHLFGLLSPGGVHSHEDHIKACVELAFSRGVNKVWLHAFLDGRDVPPKSAAHSLTEMAEHIAAHGEGGIASVCGRYFAMDRDNRWDRVELAYRLVSTGEADYSAESAIQALDLAYARDETDEFVKPTAIRDNGQVVAMDNGDAVIFMNFRADRARQLSRAFTQADFADFDRRARPVLSSFVTLTEYAADIEASTAFAPTSLANGLGEYLASLHKTQLRLAETEKYAHVTFFFNGGREQPFDGEQRVMVPSPRVATYDLAPQMSAAQVTTALVDSIRSCEFDLIVCNFANGDMVGHTGIFDAAIQAVECLDHCLAQVVEAVNAVGGQCLITADHGNVEQMRDASTGQPHTAHTSELVPLIYIGETELQLDTGGSLSDVAPTLLSLMQLEQPMEMTGRSLVIHPTALVASH